MTRSEGESAQRHNHPPRAQTQPRYYGMVALTWSKSVIGRGLPIQSDRANPGSATAAAAAARLLLFLQPEHVHVAGAAPPQPDQVAAAPRPPGRALPQRSGQGRQTLRVFRLLLRCGFVSASVYTGVRINAPRVAGTRRFVSEVFHATGSAGAQAPQPPRNIEKAPTQNLRPGVPECIDSKANSHVSYLREMGGRKSFRKCCKKCGLIFTSKILLLTSLYST